MSPNIFFNRRPAIFLEINVSSISYMMDIFICQFATISKLFREKTPINKDTGVILTSVSRQRAINLLLI